MRKVLYLFSEFTDQDIDWVVGAGARESVASGTVLVEQGQLVQTLYIVLSGKLSVTANSGSEDVMVLTELGPGEIIGELSFLDSRPPSVTVTATEESIVLAIPASRLHSKLRTDTGFASRFYRALGVLLAFRLRERSTQLVHGAESRLDDDVEAPGEMSPESLDTLNLAGSRFEQMVEQILAGR